VLAVAAPIITAPSTVGTSIGLRATVEADTRPRWQIALDTMDRALAAGDINGADKAWRDAYGLAVHSRQWEALLAVGDGALRIGDGAPLKQPYQARARKAWSSALFLAGAQRSVEGVLQVAESFATLGDTEVVTQALDIADQMARADATGEARRRVLTLRERIVHGARPTTLADPLLVLFPDASVGP
jgi:hypothetical protein